MKRHVIMVCAGFVALGLALNCNADRAASESVLGSASETSRFYFSSSEGDTDDIADFYFRLFKIDYVRRLNDSERYRQGSVETVRIPYSDGWFPEAYGGTNQTYDDDDPNTPANTVGALTQYDKAFYGGQPKAVDWESRKHAETVSWYGHCNGFSAASSRHQNPTKSVYRPQGCTPGSSGCVEFMPKHIRALLAEVYMSAKFKFLGGTRCEVPKENLSNSPQNRADPLTMDACDDVDPASFHLALVNLIGIQKQVLVYDDSRDQQVWNFPLYKYDYTLENNGQRLSRAQAAQLVGRTGANDYAFNPDAKSFVRVSMNIYFSKALGTPNAGAVAPTQEETRNFRYLLELDAQDNIIGGEWLDNSRASHPDFVWLPFEPYTPADDRKNGNPLVSASEVFALWAESMGFDPKNPFTDPKNPNRILSMPDAGLAWGNHDPYFKARLDGSNNGAVFLGKKTKIQIDRLAKLQGDATLELMVNGDAVANLRAGGADKMIAEFDAQPGVNTIEFHWNGSKTLGGANIAMRFYAMR